MKNFQQMQDVVYNWAVSQFKGNLTSEGIFEHLKEELEDLRNNPYDSLAYADVLILLMTLAKHNHCDMDEIFLAVEAKQRLNEARIWLEPDSKGVIRHKKLADKNSNE